MKKQPIPIEMTPTLSERLSQSSFLIWMVENGKIVAWMASAIVVGLLLAYQLLQSYSSRISTQYLAAETLYYKMRSTSGDQSAEAAGQLAELLDKQPDLRAIYEGKLTQYLLLSGDASDAERLLNRQLERVATHSRPLFRRYAQVSLLIAQKDFPRALDQALSLQEQLQEDPELQRTVLFPSNLLRIGMLQQKLGLSDDEQATWDSWSRYAQEEKLAPYFGRVSAVYTEGEVTLEAYHQHRLKDS